MQSPVKRPRWELLAPFFRHLLAMRQSELSKQSCRQTGSWRPAGMMPASVPPEQMLPNDHCSFFPPPKACCLAWCAQNKNDSFLSSTASLIWDEQLKILCVNKKDFLECKFEHFLYTAMAQFAVYQRCVPVTHGGLDGCFMPQNWRVAQTKCQETGELKCNLSLYYQQ